MPAPVIQAQYDKLQTVAQRFGAQAEATGQLRQRLLSGVQSLQNGGWEGRGAQAFFNEMSQDVFPAMQRLQEALQEAQFTTLQIIEIFQEAEKEAAAPFRGQSIPETQSPHDGTRPSPEPAEEHEDGGFWDVIEGVVSEAWDFIVDHRDEVALAGAVVAAGVATVATGGTAAPILAGVIAGAATAGGLTLGINAASPQYPLMDGVLQNTIGGAVIGFGVGSIGNALATAGLEKTLISGVINSAIDFSGQLANQIFMQNQPTVWHALRAVDYGDVGVSFVKGMVFLGSVGHIFDKAGGILRLGLGRTAGLGFLGGMSSEQVGYLLQGGLDPGKARGLGFLSPSRMAYDGLLGGISLATTYGVAKSVQALHPWAFRHGLYDRILYQRIFRFTAKTPSWRFTSISRMIVYQPGWDTSHPLGRFLSRLEMGEGISDVTDFLFKSVGL